MTEPFKKVLDPDFSIVGIQNIIGDVSPLMREVINHATWAYQRCLSEKSSHGGLDEDLAPLTLYRQVIETSDAIDVLLRSSCVASCVPLLRSSLEAWLSLEYILRENFAQRSLSWLCGHNHNRLRACRLLDSSLQAGKEFEETWEKEFGEQLILDQREAQEAIANIEAILKEPHMAPIDKEWQTKKGRPRWFSLFGGPSNLRDLAKILGYVTVYDVYYRNWSAIAHASDLGGHLSHMSTGEMAFKSIRHPGGLPHRAHEAINLLLRSTAEMLKHYRPGEEESFGRWYTGQVEPGIEKIERLKIEIHVIEEH